jgi:predicted nucleic acid-binding Zn ribbon protein
MADANPLANNDDDVQLQGYQDDFDTSGKTDDVTHSMTDDATDDYQIPAAEMREELNNRAVEDEGNADGNNEARFGSDDALNEIEDRDEDVTNEN